MAVVERVAFGCPRVFEAAVANHFCIEAAVHAVVDLFEKDAVHAGIWSRPDFGRIDENGGGVGRDCWR